MKRLKGRVKMGGWRRLGNEASAVHVSSTSSSVVPANRITQTDTPVTGIKSSNNGWCWVYIANYSPLPRQYHYTGD